MNYAITASTGRFGQKAIKYLLELVDPGDQVIAIARNLDKAKNLLPQDVEVRYGDYDDLDSMKEALRGVDRVLFISSQPGGPVTRAEQHQNMVEALKMNQVKFVAYTSFPNAQNSKSALASDHKNTENLIKESGLAHTFLRNNWYLENEIGFLQAGANNKTATYWANNAAGFALEREYAEAAARILVEPSPESIYELAGPSRSFNELGVALQTATGNDFSIKQVSHSDYIKELEQTGLDKNSATLFASFQEPIDDGSLNESTTALANILGRPLTNLPDAINEVLKS